MICIICKNGETEPGFGSMTFDLDGTTIIYRDVPADICENCGETYFAHEVANRLLEEARKASISGVQVLIRHYEAA
ncbi:type II toxin-antitoxin system MqsA family antitoxin [bacterium]|nr:type II toxin-antitoxin system MqsA family antitoxin [bacterium]